MTDTARLGLPYPVDANPADVPTWMRDLATELDTILPPDAQGPIGSRPAAGVRGALYTSTNEGSAPVTYRDDGTAWRRIGNTIQRVTSLPLNPGDGDVVPWEYNEGTANPQTWTMRWNAALGVWEYVGGAGAMLWATGSTIVLGGNAHTNVLPAANPLPHGGAWNFKWGAVVRNVGLQTPNTVQTVRVGPMVNGNNGGVLNALVEWAVGPSVASYILTSAVTLVGAQVFGAVAKNDVIVLGARGSLGGNPAYQFEVSDRWMEYHPVRLTP